MKKALLALALLTLSLSVIAPGMAYAEEETAIDQLNDANDSGQEAVNAPTDEDAKDYSNQVFDGN